MFPSARGHWATCGQPRRAAKAGHGAEALFDGLSLVQRDRCIERVNALNGDLLRAAGGSPLSSTRCRRESKAADTSAPAAPGGLAERDAHERADDLIELTAQVGFQRGKMAERGGYLEAREGFAQGA